MKKFPSGSYLQKKLFIYKKIPEFTKKYFTIYKKKNI